MATTSADPHGMDAFLAQVRPEAADLPVTLQAAAGAINDFEAAPCDPAFRIGGLGGGVRDAITWSSEITDDDNFVTAVRNVFVRADVQRSPTPTSMPPWPTPASPRPRPRSPSNDPVYNGAVMLSGWSNDPVCTATGHFFEVEEDLAMPDPLRVLRWARSYSSRHISDGGQGRGWSSWATTRLEIMDGDVVRFWGPDGRRADVVLAADDRPVAVVGVEGTFARLGGDGQGGYELRWRWSSSWPGMTWQFDPAGLLCAIHDPFGGPTSCVRGPCARALAADHNSSLAW